MNSPARKSLLLRAVPLAVLALLCACGKAPEARFPEKDAKSLPPAIIAPADVADSAEPPSYEVGVATAAAHYNHAREKCAEKSERLRAMCEADADAAFAGAEAELEDLRGNQP